MNYSKRINLLLVITVITFLCCTTCFADYSVEDYSSIGYKEVYDYKMTTSLYMEVYQKTLVNSETGERTDYFKTSDGEKIEHFYTIDGELNEENPTGGLIEWYRHVPQSADDLQTVDGIIIKPALSGEITKFELKDGSWIELYPDTLINEDLLYPYYTVDGHGVTGYREYGICGDENVIYLLANQEQPTYKVTLYPDTHFAMISEWDEGLQYPTFAGCSGEYFTLPECPYNKDGYKFVCWDDEYNQYQAGDRYRIPNRDCTLRAVWSKNTPVEDDEPETDNDRPSFNWFPIINQIQNNKPEPEKDNTTVSPEPDKYTCPYKDISGHWAEDIIKFIDELGLIDGITATQFQPNEPMTREMFVTAVARLAGVESDYVSWAINNGILLGYGNGEYGLTDTVTREQMAVFFLRYFEKMGIDADDFRITEPYTFADDESISDWASGAVYEIQSLGLIKGKGNNIFDPQGTTTRAEAATVLYNLVQTVLAKVN